MIHGITSVTRDIFQPNGAGIGADGTQTLSIFSGGVTFVVIAAQRNALTPLLTKVGIGKGHYVGIP